MVDLGFEPPEVVMQTNPAEPEPSAVRLTCLKVEQARLLGRVVVADLELERLRIVQEIFLETYRCILAESEEERALSIVLGLESRVGRADEDEDTQADLMRARWCANHAREETLSHGAARVALVEPPSDLDPLYIRAARQLHPDVALEEERSTRSNGMTLLKHAFRLADAGQMRELAGPDGRSTSLVFCVAIDQARHLRECTERLGSTLVSQKQERDLVLLSTQHLRSRLRRRFRYA